MVIALLVEDTIPIAIDNEHAVARRNPYVAWHAYIFQRLFQHDLGAPGASHIAKLRSNSPGNRYKVASIGRHPATAIDRPCLMEIEHFAIIGEPASCESHPFARAKENPQVGKEQRRERGCK